MVFAEPDRLLWLLLLPVLLFLVVLSIARSVSLLRRFTNATMLQRLAPGLSPWRHALPSLVLLLAMACVIVALARPRWGSEERTVARLGRDVAFLIDVSRSMLAEDLAPNRLQRAKIWAADAIDARAGDRVAIVGFAGGVNIASPLSFDHAFAMLALDGLDTDSISLGGTNIGDAIRRTVSEVFEISPDRTPEIRQRDIVLITDGEDHGSLPIEAAAAAAEHGIRIITIGIGSTRGVNIPLRGNAGRPQTLEHDGQPVVTRLDMAALRAIANATPGGHAIEVETGDIDLADVYGSLVQAAATSDAAMEATATQNAERFQWFLIPAIALLLLERAIPLTRRVKNGVAP